MSGSIRKTEGCLPYFIRRLTAVKNIDSYREFEKSSELSRRLRWLDLIFLGIGATVGSGIFVVAGGAAANHAGPSVIISFVIAAFTALLAALSYAELTTMIPVSGSAYMYAYSTLGEAVAWIMAWNMVLEFMVAAATVAVGWSAYLVSFFSECGVNMTNAEPFMRPPFQWVEEEQKFITSNNYFNIPGFVVVILCTIILLAGMKESTMFNHSMVVLKVGIILIFFFGTVSQIKSENYDPFIPPTPEGGQWNQFGMGGMLSAATTVFFAYVGFDSVSTAALECHNPQKDIPIGIIGSLGISTLLYIAVVVVMTGSLRYTNLGGDAPFSDVAQVTGKWLSILLCLGILAGLTSVILVNILAQTRVFFVVASDGLLPSAFTKIHPRTKTPWVITIVVGVATAILGGCLPVNILGNLSSVGTLTIFLLVHVGVIILRRNRPEVSRPFRIPGPGLLWLFFPVTGILSCIGLIFSSSLATLYRLLGWLFAGLIIYLLYGFRHSKIRHMQVPSETEPLL